MNDWLIFSLPFLMTLLVIDMIAVAYVVAELWRHR